MIWVEIVYLPYVAMFLDEAARAPEWPGSEI